VLHPFVTILKKVNQNLKTASY